MKETKRPRLLLVSSEPTHREAYASSLARLYVVERAATTRNDVADVGAVVYDAPRQISQEDCDWLSTVTVPLVVLIPDKVFELWLPDDLRAPHRVLVYPVLGKEIVKALGELGVNAP